MVIVVACCHSLSLKKKSTPPIDQRPSHGRRRRRRPRAGSESDPRSPASSSAVDGGGEERSPIGGSARDGLQSPRGEFRPKNLSLPAGRLRSFRPTPQRSPFYTSLTAFSFSADDEPSVDRSPSQGSSLDA